MNVFKYLIFIIVIVCQPVLLVDAGTLSKRSAAPMPDLIARHEALPEVGTDRIRGAGSLTGAGHGLDVFRNSMHLIVENYVEKISDRDLLKMVLDKLVLVVLPPCVEDIGKCSEDVDNCFVRDINSLSARCNLDVNRLLFTVLNMVVQDLDPNSCMMDAGMLKELEIGTTGKFGGVGMVVSAKKGDYVVVSPFGGSPAYKAGIRAGDTILQIDGQPLHGLSLLQVLHRVRGPAGSSMSVKVIDSKSGSVRQVQLRRRMIKIPPVRHLLLERRIGYLRIINFQEGTASEVRKALGQFLAHGSRGLAGLILDLRDNPGGLFGESIQVANLFKPSGILTSVRGRHSNLNRDFKANGRTRVPQLPIVILINKGTASASEILAGALQGLPEVSVMGERSFGKASVQAVFPLGQGMAIRLTTAHYYTAEGRDIDGKGLEPDILIHDSDDSSTRGKIELLDGEQLKNDAGVKAALAYLRSGERPVHSPFSSWY
ncbi:MAG: S41 family peptidase [Desulfomonilaceae bacterium]